MGGGLMQLVAYGAQDVYLTGNPQITFFKVVYRRYTNFAMESIEQTFNGAVDFGKRVTATISRNGDLIHKMYLQTTLPALSNASNINWCRYPGLALIKSVEIEIGGQKIDKHYGEWLYIWNELTQAEGKKEGYKTMVGDDLAAAPAVSKAATTLFIPLEFWFNRNPGLALPLIALQYHEVKVNFEFRQLSELVYVGTGGGALPTAALGSTSLWVDYIFLDTDERRRFAQSSHEFLIEQLQFTGDESISGTAGNDSSHKIKLSFNHPCKEFIWVLHNDAAVPSTATSERDWFAFGTGGAASEGSNPIKAAKLQLNGHDRFTERPGNYFSLVQPYQHHENVPEVPGINVYSFAIKPEEHQPSGTLNCSRIDSAVLNLTVDGAFWTTGTNGRVKVFAVNYNVLRLMSGMGGLAYSN